MTFRSCLSGERAAFAVFRIAALIAVGVMFAVIALLVVKGGSIIGWDFLTKAWKHRDILDGGISQAIVGSLALGLGVIAVSFPVGVATAVWCTEYNRSRFARRAIEVSVRNLSGIPSVIYGMFGLAFFVHFMRFGASLLSAILTLSVMVLPLVITSSIEALNAVPRKFRESSWALGASKWETVRRITLPTAMPGCVTGGIVGTARALGETAPIIMVGATFFMSGYPDSPFTKFMALPYHAFILSTQHASPHAERVAAGTALVLISLTTLLCAGAFIARAKMRRSRDW